MLQMSIYTHKSAIELKSLMKTIEILIVEDVIDCLEKQNNWNLGSDDFGVMIKRGRYRGWHLRHWIKKILMTLNLFPAPNRR